MFLLIDKPKGMTSHDVVDCVRKITNERRVGHGGTLDPNATGLLIVAVGRESTKKLSEQLLHQDKTYEAEIVLGEERETDDVSGQIRNSKHEIRNKSQISKSKIQNNVQISNYKIKKMLNKFLGKQMQVPPVYSAKKIKGKAAYSYARKGEDVELKPREIEIYSIKITGYKYPKLKIECKVSSGTYIRSLARDIGRKMGTGAYLGNLRRTNIGKFDVKNAKILPVLTRENWHNLAFEM